MKLLRSLSSLFTISIIILFIARKTSCSINSSGLHLVWYTHKTQEKTKSERVSLKRVLISWREVFFFVEFWTQLLSRVVELYFVKAIVSWRGQVKEDYCWTGENICCSGLNLLKESEIFAPQPEEITFFILFSIVILQFYYLLSFFTNTNLIN